MIGREGGCGAVHELHRQMAVAEMPGDARQMMRIGSDGFDLRSALQRAASHLDDPAVLQADRPVAVS